MVPSEAQSRPQVSARLGQVIFYSGITSQKWCELANLRDYASFYLAVMSHKICNWKLQILFAEYACAYSELSLEPIEIGVAFTPKPGGDLRLSGHTALFYSVLASCNDYGHGRPTVFGT